MNSYQQTNQMHPSEPFIALFPTKNQYWIDSIESDFNAKKGRYTQTDRKICNASTSAIFSEIDGPEAVFLFWGRFYFPFLILNEHTNVSIFHRVAFKTRSCGGYLIWRAKQRRTDTADAHSFLLRSNWFVFATHVCTTVHSTYCCCTRTHGFPRIVHTDCVCLLCSAIDDALWIKRWREIRFCSVWHYDNCMIKNHSKC